ncbi:MAG: glutamate ligase domain-containing protein, partial [Planctomycetota bacterium]
PGGEYAGLPIPLAGHHQGGNAAVAVGVLDLLGREKNLAIPAEVLRRGWRNLRVPGRLERVRDEPLLLIDVAHNEVAIRASLEAIETFYPHRRLFVGAGFSKDKDLPAVFEPLAPRVSRLFLTSAGGPRAADPHALASIARAAGCTSVEVIADVGAMVDEILSACGQGDLALITGSFYVAGMAYEYLGIDVG